MQDEPTPRAEEFAELGLERVRRELLLRRWPADKLAAARQWVEREDTRIWQVRRGDAPAKPKSGWQRKWLGYVVTAVGLAYAAVRVVRMLKQI